MRSKHQQTKNVVTLIWQSTVGYRMKRHNDSISVWAYIDISERNLWETMVNYGVESSDGVEPVEDTDSSLDSPHRKLH
jgi:hypothetical protein